MDRLVEVSLYKKDALTKLVSVSFNSSVILSSFNEEIEFKVTKTLQTALSKIERILINEKAIFPQDTGIGFDENDEKLKDIYGQEQNLQTSDGEIKAES